MLASPAMGQPQSQACMPRDNALKQLATKYQEHPVAVGVTNNYGLVEVLTTEDGSTWSIIVTDPGGISCLVSAGEGWRTKKPPPSRREMVL